MGRRGKIAIIIIAVILILIGIAVPFYFYCLNKTDYAITGIEKNGLKVEDFVADSKLQFYQNGTFYVQIKHKDKGLSFTGIGTYKQDGKTYQLKFYRAYARNNEDNIVDYTDQCNDITCVRTGNRIKFTDHKSQTFYFG